MDANILAGRTNLQVSDGYVELSGDSGLAPAVPDRRIRHLARRVGSFLRRRDAADGEALRRIFRGYSFGADIGEGKIRSRHSAADHVFGSRRSSDGD